MAMIGSQLVIEFQFEELELFRVSTLVSASEWVGGWVLPNVACFWPDCMIAPLSSPATPIHEPDDHHVDNKDVSISNPLDLSRGTWVSLLHMIFMFLYCVLAMSCCSCTYSIN